MALVSSFYDGPVTEGDRARNRAGAPDYGVYGTGDFKVVANGAVPLSVKVKAGRAHGWGVTDLLEADETLMCEAPGAGVTRWDLIVVRRNWQPLGGGPSTLVVIKGGPTTLIPAGRKVGPGVEDDQPIAMVGWKAGQTAPFQIIDLRCWAHNGGVEIANEIAFEYLARPGAAVHYAGWTWRYALEDNGVWEWSMAPGVTSTRDGIMLATDKKKLDDATAIDTANALMRRDGNGRARIKNPAGSMDITNKGSVDALIASARSYAASQASSALASAKSYAASQASSALASAKSYAASQASTALNSAKNYALGLVKNLRPAATGTRGVGSVSDGGSAVNLPITFPPGRFSKAPGVTFTPHSSRINIGIQSISKDGAFFTASNYSGAASGSFDVTWTAVQE